MKIDIRSENSLFIELNGYTYYIDDSTNEQIIEKYEEISIEFYSNVVNCNNICSG